ncbi:hypothetical protein AB0F81_25910 [Actinoplanes sp. NPDC024001]|uniref:hypothetical protein n=1 Tax=Actinoplanes sp. NPDC024001 TaxID=3154598 RepID=UPI0033F69F97
MSDLHVDPELLDGIAERLRRCGDSIDAVGGGAPALPDAGVDTATIAAIVGKLCESSANLVDGLLAVSTGVAAASRSYAGEDAASAGKIASGLP